MQLTSWNNLLLIHSQSCWLNGCNVFVAKFYFNILILACRSKLLVLSHPSFFLFSFYLNFCIYFRKPLYIFGPQSARLGESLILFPFGHVSNHQKAVELHPDDIFQLLSSCSLIPEAPRSTAISSASRALKDKSNIPWEASYLEIWLSLNVYFGLVGSLEQDPFFLPGVPIQLAACQAFSVWPSGFAQGELSCNHHRIKTFNYHGSLTSIIPFKFQSHAQTSGDLWPAAHTSVQWWTHLLRSRVTLPAVPHTILVFTLELLFVSRYFFLLYISSRNMDF